MIAAFSRSFFISLLALASIASAQDATKPTALPQWVSLFNGRDLTGWVNVNTAPDTFSVKDGILVCTGKPIGVMRSEKQYENFILHIEWMHKEAGGNSGVFVWSDPFPAPGSPLPKGVEVQMLELDWPNQHRDKDGNPAPIAYVHGEVWGTLGMTTKPDNARGERSMSLENRCLPRNAQRSPQPFWDVRAAVRAARNEVRQKARRFMEWYAHHTEAGVRGFQIRE